MPLKAILDCPNAQCHNCPPVRFKIKVRYSFVAFYHKVIHDNHGYLAQAGKITVIEAIFLVPGLQNGWFGDRVYSGFQWWNWTSDDSNSAAPHVIVSFAEDVRLGWFSGYKDVEIQRQNRDGWGKRGF